MDREFKTTKVLINEAIWGSLKVVSESLEQQIYWADNSGRDTHGEVLRDVQQAINNALEELERDR